MMDPKTREQEAYDWFADALQVLEMARLHLHTIHSNPGRDADWLARHGLSRGCPVSDKIAAFQRNARVYYDNRCAVLSAERKELQARGMEAELLPDDAAGVLRPR